MNSTHTPGPWTNDNHSTYVYSIKGNVCICGDPHASGYVSYTECKVGSQYLGEAVANARLIAQAPAMAGVLFELHALLDFEEPGSDDKPWIFRDWSDINAAFAKAYAIITALRATGAVNG